MVNKLSNIKERALQVAKYHKTSYETFSEGIGMTYGSFKGTAKMSPLNSDAIENILTNYPDVDAEWLLTGKGTMLKEEAVSDVKINDRFKLRTDRNKDSQLVPLYELETSAGLVSLFMDSVNNRVIDYIRIPDLPPVDGAVHVRGDSMYPILKSGDIVLYKRVQDLQYGIIWGEIYMVSFETDGEEYIVLKYVQRSEKEGHVRLVSQNSHHAPMDIPLERIRAIAIIKASVRYNTMG